MMSEAGLYSGKTNLEIIKNSLIQEHKNYQSYRDAELLLRTRVKILEDIVAKDIELFGLMQADLNAANDENNRLRKEAGK